MGASVINSISYPDSIKFRPFAPDKDKGWNQGTQVETKKSNQSSLTILSIKAWELAGYILNVISILPIAKYPLNSQFLSLEIYPQRSILRNVSLNSYFKGFLKNKYK